MVVGTVIEISTAVGSSAWRKTVHDSSEVIAQYHSSFYAASRNNPLAGSTVYHAVLLLVTNLLRAD